MENLVIAEEVKVAINLLNKHNFEAYLVGGTVRDFLLNKQSNDYDLCSSALVSDMIDIFSDYKIILTGAEHGTITLIINSVVMEITTFRVDGEYGDNRRPNNVVFTDNLKEDLQRRDFTINALAYNEEKGIIDYFDGIIDLDNKIIKAVGNPDLRFKEDALRILRGIRFASNLGFDIEAKTKQAMFENKELLKNLSKERITKEFILLLAGKNVTIIYHEFLSVLQVVLNELKEQEEIYSFDDGILALSYLLKDYRYQEVEMIVKTRLSLSNDMQREIKILTKYFNSKPKNKYEMLVILSEIDVELFKKLVVLWSVGSKVSEVADMYYQIVNSNDCFRIRDLQIDGNDLIELGYNGVEIKDALAELLNEVMLGNVVNQKKELIVYIQRKNLKNYNFIA